MSWFKKEEAVCHWCGVYKATRTKDLFDHWRCCPAKVDSYRLLAEYRAEYAERQAVETARARIDSAVDNAWEKFVP